MHTKPLPALLLAVLLGVALSLGAPRAATAQEDDEFSGTTEDDGGAAEEEAEVVYRDKTILDFEDLMLEGEVKKPTGATIIERQQLDFTNLIKEREDFEPEMVQSVDSLR